jgi:quercetin dioxygenase-like cupin family protein
MEKRSLTLLGREQLAAAKANGSGRSAHAVYGGALRTLRQTLLALTAGSALEEHDSPGEATLIVLQGRVRLTGPGAGPGTGPGTGRDTGPDAEPDAGPDTGPDAGCDAVAGDHLVIPPTRHSLSALEDSVVLLTVAKPHA